ncbi:TlpA disulfide reductase family protein [Pontibacter vulgaris]|uniref:TlpA disulfide reductase family protein n=1 Tax=Pontibacter vulgaris TaxID=2905679 RepID=UPI001FA776A9|nr:TlpA disulfide reductase family protein [Pontibacter vulgaris]
MKKVHLLLLLAFLSVASNVSAQSKAILKGKVTNSLADEVILVTRPSQLVPQEAETKATLTKDQFVLEAPVTAPTMSELVHGNESIPVYLEPGFALTVAFDGDNFIKSIKFEGKGANENNYLAAYTLRFDEEEDYQVLPDNIRFREKEFLAFLDSRKKDQLKNLEKYLSKYPVSEKFKAYAQAEIDFNYANDRLTYIDLRERIVMSEKRLIPSAGYYSFLNELDLQRPANLLSSSYTTFLCNYTSYLAKQAGLKETDATYYKASYNLAKQKFTGNAQTIALLQVLKQSLQKGHVKYSQEIVQDFNNNYKLPEATAFLATLSNNRELAAGSAAPAFKLADVNGKETNLSDFKGKLIYLSFWRTDCGLCLVEQPHLQELIGKFAGKNVAFINISLDDDVAAWQNMVKKKQLQGINLHQGTAELAKQFGLKDAPAYFLIDGNGDIISIKARRPTDRETPNEITRYLNSSDQASAR